MNNMYLAPLRIAARTLLAQGALHGELLLLEWEEEKQRLSRMLVTLLVGMLCLFCSLLSIGALVLILSWNTPYQHVVLYALVSGFCLCTAAACYRLHVLALLGQQAFADTRAEFSAELALIRHQLDE